MRADELRFLVDWFSSHCDGDWEHEAGIRIETLDNPGWAIDIRIEDTALDGCVTDWVTVTDDASRWLHWRSTGTHFEARCGVEDLERALVAFKEFATQKGR